MGMKFLDDSLEDNHLYLPSAQRRRRAACDEGIKLQGG
jgi:hypothetical protein